MGMALYSLLLLAVFGVGGPYWLVRMATSGRYRAGLAGRLGRVPRALREAVAGRQVVWLHAVSVGEVLAATRLVAELEEALGAGWIIVLSTTTATGQALACERFGAGPQGGSCGRVFWYPLDFAWAVRAYLRVLRPRLLVLMESELWPRMLVECKRAGIPVAVVNARVSDRSYRRGIKVKAIWGRLLRLVTMFLAQSDEDGRRLAAMGARAESVRVAGNLKYDVRAPGESTVADWIREIAGERPVVVAGSLGDRTGGQPRSEEEMVIQAWEGPLRLDLDTLLVLAPRHPERFGSVEAVAMEFGCVRASDRISRRGSDLLGRVGRVEIVLLDTIGDLAAVYGIADAAFVGGSLVKRGGHNPLEPAQFGVPVVMGPSFENFRDVVGRMKTEDGIRIVRDGEGLAGALLELLTDRETASVMGERGRRVFEQQQGATATVVEALISLVKT